VQSPIVAAIPSGGVTTRMPLGLPLYPLVLVAVVAVLPFLAMQTLWGAVICIPVWGFLRYHAKKEPLFVEIWAGQYNYEDYYQP